MIARFMIGDTRFERDVDPVLVVEGRDQLPVAAEHAGALRERLRLELGRQVLHRLCRGAGAVADAPRQWDDQARGEHAEDRGDGNDDPEVGDHGAEGEVGYGVAAYHKSRGEGCKSDRMARRI